MVHVTNKLTLDTRCLIHYFQKQKRGVKKKDFINYNNIQVIFV